MIFFGTKLEILITICCLATQDNYVVCPNCDCTWEFIAGNQEDAPDFDKIMGIDNRPVKDPARHHYLSHRVCCRECGTNFCR